MLLRTTDTKNVTILKNFSHITGTYVKGEHHKVDALLALEWINANLVAECIHSHENETESVSLLEVPETVIAEVEQVIQTKNTRKSRKKVVKNDV